MIITWWVPWEQRLYHSFNLWQASIAQRSKTFHKYLMWKWSESESHLVVSDSFQSHGLLHGSPWILQARILECVAIPFSQGIFPTQRSNPGLLHCRQILCQLNHQGSPRILEWVAYPFWSRSSQPKNRTGVSCIADGFSTSWAICSNPSSWICTDSGSKVNDHSGKD